MSPSPIEKTKKKENVRLYWLDALKGLAILAVIIGHLFNAFQNHKLYPDSMGAIRLIRNWIYTWHMPFFITLSGFSFSLAYVKGQVKKNKIQHQIKKLLVLYLIFNGLLSILKIIYALLFGGTPDFKELFINILCPDNIFWYLWVLIIYYLIFGTLALAQKLKKTYLMLVFLLISGIVAYFWRLAADAGDWRLGLVHLIYEIPFFAFGIFLAKLHRKEKESMLLTLVVCAISLFFTLAYLFTPAHYHSLGTEMTTLLQMLFSFSFSIFLFFSAQGWPVGNKNILLIWGQNSLVIYLIHKYVITFYTALLTRLPKGSFLSLLRDNAKIGFLLGLFLCLAVSMAAAYLLKWVKKKHRQS